MTLQSFFIELFPFSASGEDGEICHLANQSTLTLLLIHTFYSYTLIYLGIRDSLKTVSFSFSRRLEINKSLDLSLIISRKR